MKELAGRRGGPAPETHERKETKETVMTSCRASPPSLSLSFSLSLRLPRCGYIFALNTLTTVYARR